MLQISEQNENSLLELAKLTHHSVNKCLEMLIENYQDDLDVKEAEQALQEQGGISISELKSKYEL